MRSSIDLLIEAVLEDETDDHAAVARVLAAYDAGKLSREGVAAWFVYRIGKARSETGRPILMLQ